MPTFQKHPKPLGEDFCFTNMGGLLEWYNGLNVSLNLNTALVNILPELIKLPYSYLH
jgi:hypothetical protein